MKPLDVLMKRGIEGVEVVRALDYDLLLKVQDGYCVSDMMIEEVYP